MEVGGIEPHTRVVAQGFTPYCDQIVTVLGEQEMLLGILAFWINPMRESRVDEVGTSKFNFDCRWTSMPGISHLL